MTNPSPHDDTLRQYPIVGRDSRIDLAKYTVRVHGRDIIDYEKLKADNPALYQDILKEEARADRRIGEELDELTS